ncbi:MULTISPECIES: ParM/StbA family protein [Vibrio]|uniref:ParM/StbA family protein n=1 Tax=Vibrio TaxID=662 RepID=UPI00078C45C3|nr:MULTISPECIES: ParM/StbA family protein [Vibrio]BAU70801.1 hypothetical protein [Vibrio sp. 04Ya108]BBM67631.1 hypothetical protein VA249_42770 [Vibrio alfacsensis]BCN27113.1 hypothetical protein VYA_43050 [Vibrio alfacsensis]
MNIAQDIGSGLTKFKMGNITGFFPSLVGSVDMIDTVSNTLGLAPAHAFRFRDKLYLTGDVAGAKVEHQNLENTQTDDFALSDSNLVLILSSILAVCLHEDNYEFGNTVEEKIDSLSKLDAPLEVNTCLGLPIAKFSDNKTAYNEHVKGVHAVQLLTGQTIKFNINHILVLPQCAATIYTLQAAKPNVDWSKRSVGLIDVGTHTLGMATFYNGNFVPAESDGFSKAGMYHMANKTRQSLKTFTHAPLRIDRILNGFRMGQMMLNGNDIDMVQFVESLDPLRDDVKQYLTDVWNLGGDREVVIVGGGSSYFAPAIKKIIPHAILLEPGLDKNIFAVVDGMYQHFEAMYE